VNVSVEAASPAVLVITGEALSVPDPRRNEKSTLLLAAAAPLSTTTACSTMDPLLPGATWMVGGSAEMDSTELIPFTVSLTLAPLASVAWIVAAPVDCTRTVTEASPASLVA
jgi:hypothetical protein